MILTYRYRLKKPYNLPQLARSVNFVWNYCGEIQNLSKTYGRRWPSHFDLTMLLVGSGVELGLHSDTTNRIAHTFVQSRNAAKHRPRWRVSGGPRRSLGWVPFVNARAIQVRGDTVTYKGHTYRLWLHRPIGGKVLAGSFAEDARGRWYLNLSCEVPEGTDCGVGTVGIDLGLKDLAVTSDGEVIENPRPYQRQEKQLASAQRAGRKRRAKTIAAKIGATRRHALHVASARLVRRYKTIVVGNVTLPAGKSTLDASWSAFRRFLHYKALRHGGKYVEVSERFSTQACSECGSLGGPKGLEGLGVREWQCVGCGTVHHRDVNAARNLLLSGQNADLQLTGIR